MNKRRIYLYSALLILVFIAWVVSDANNNNSAENELTKIALREVGHKLLLANGDSTSIVLPVIEMEPSRYKLSFKEQLSIVPDSLVAIVQHSFKKAGLSEFYIVEVMQCTNNEVAYSYKMRNDKDKNIVPCRSRSLPKSCYIIETRFLNRQQLIFNKKTLLLVLGFIVVIMLVDGYRFKREQATTLQNNPQEHTALGKFMFFPEQNKLVKEAVEIELSKKECELLSIFIERPNQVIKRDELTKRVWEDNGVIVGRSLDTYISKLRKKLKDDESIKLTNVHGVGYKLEVT